MGAKQISRARAGRCAAAADDERRTILDAIRHIVRVLRVSSRAAERRVGLSAAQLFALHKLADGRALSLNELAERTFTHQSSVSVVVARLQGRGLVTRRRSSADGRRIELALTGAGRALLRRAPAAAQERLIAALDQLGAAERRRLSQTLGRLVRTMGMAGEPPMLFEEPERRRE